MVEDMSSVPGVSANNESQQNPPIQPEIKQEAVQGVGGLPAQSEQQAQAPETTKPVAEKRWDRKDVLAAGDPKAVLEAYHNATKDRFANRADLQSTVGERLTQLGDVEHGMQFTLMGEQTRNTERFGQMVEAYQDTTKHFGNSIGEFEEHNRMFGRSMGQMEDNVRVMDRAASRMEEVPAQMNRSASVMNDATEQFGRAASRLDGAAEQINQASYRMQR